MASRFPQGQSQSALYSALASLLDRLVDCTESHIDELIARFVAESLLTSFQKEAVENKDAEVKTKEVFDCVLDAVARNDSLFDRLIPILRDLGYGHLADELLRAAFPISPSGPPGYQRSRPGAAVSGPTSCCENSSHSHQTVNAYHGPELDSGSATRNPTGQLEAACIDDDVPEQMLDRLHFSRSTSDSSSRFSTEEHSSSGTNENQNQYSHTTNDPSTLPPITTNSNFNATLLQPRLDLHVPQMVQPQLELHEPVVDLHNEEHKEASTSILPNNMIDGERFMSETTANSNGTIEDGLILSLADRIHHLHVYQELQQKGAEGMQKDAENLELQDKLREQKQETKRIEKEMDATIKDWKQRYEDQENRVKCLTEQITHIEKEKEEMTVQHKAEITELNAKHRRAEENNEEKVAEYQTKIITLEKNLEEANLKKEKAEIALAQARGKIGIILLKLETEKELSNMKDQQHALQLNMWDLNKEVLKKELLFHSKDNELAEERHAQERHHRLALQQQIEILQRELQIERLRSQSSGSSTQETEGREEANKQEQDIVFSAEEEKHIGSVQKAMEERRMLDHTIVHGVFVGPARSGKNSLMERLLGRMPSSVSPSTGVAESVVQVKVIQKSTTFAANVKESIWSVMDYDDEAIKLMLINSESKVIEEIKIQEDVDIANSGASLPESRNTILGIGENETATDSESDDEWFEAESSLPYSLPAAQSSSTQCHPEPQLPDSYVPPLEIIKDALRRKGKSGLETLQQHFQKTWSLYLTNTGGQMEFQEVLPLLVSGPSMFFFTFRLDRDITQRYVIEYEVSGGDKAELYTSTLSIVESLLQTLSTVAAMGTFVYKGLQRTKTALTPKVFIIGTHKDQLKSNTADEYIAKVDQQLQKAIKETSYYDHLIEFASSTRLIFTVDNFSESDVEFKNIRSAVERVVRNEFQMTSPAHWLIFSLALRKLKPNVVSFEQCLKIAKQCGLKDNEVTEALQFIHSKMGLIRFFPYEGVKDLVVIHPQFLFDKVTDLIVDTFTFKKVGIPKMTKFKQNGIFSLSEFEAVSSRSSANIRPFPLAKLLESLRIAAPFQKDDETMYFFPCVLAHALEDEYQQLMLTETQISQLIVTFECGYCPKGLAGALIKYLMANEMESCYTWEIHTDKIFRNQVSFHVGPLDTIVLRIRPTYLEIICIPGRFPNRDKKCPLTEICTEVHKAIEAGIKQVTSDINYVNTQHGLAFHCECKGDHPGKLELLPNGEPYCLSYRKTGETYDLPSGYELWQIHKIDKADSGTTPSLEKYSLDVAGGGAASGIPSSIPALQQQFQPLLPQTDRGTPPGHMVYIPYPQFTNRGLPTGHNVIMIPLIYGYPPVLMPPQQGTAAQPHTTMASPFMPIGGIRYPAFSQDTGSATGAPSMPQSVGYPAQVQHPTLFGAHSEHFSYHQQSLSEPGRLTQYHLGGLVGQLSQHATKWRDIGTHLGFLPGELSNIEASPSLWQGAPVSWLSAMLAQWLQRTSSATLEDLKTALSKAGLAAAAHDLKL